MKEVIVSSFYFEMINNLLPSLLPPFSGTRSRFKIYLQSRFQICIGQEDSHLYILDGYGGCCRFTLVSYFLDGKHFSFNSCILAVILRWVRKKSSYTAK